MACLMYPFLDHDDVKQAMMLHTCAVMILVKDLAGLHGRAAMTLVRGLTGTMEKIRLSLGLGKGTLGRTSQHGYG
jgi:hypothetical protein